LLGDDVESFEGTSDRLLSRKTWAVLIAVVVSSAAVLSTVSYFVFFGESEQSMMTMTQLVDKMRDADGDGIPDEFIPYDEGDNVTVRDQLIGYEYSEFGFGVLYTLKFSYTGEKWKDAYGLMGYVPAFLWTNASLCSYGDGDWITLNGTIEVYEWNDSRTELVNWSVVGDIGPFELPSIELNLTHVSNTTWRVVVSGGTLECKLWHFDFVLRKYGLGMDWINQPEHGERSIYMEFWDIDKDGCLSEGDVLYAMPDEEGDYDLAVFYHSDELANVSWHYSP
ncbi:MAG: hypothetical protein LN417_03550, partial [Candidatus Thermoplasmatota archaeon]|nr:hypothetical protein [Candidatus Thermoplasmatota archaeon]